MAEYQSVVQPFEPVYDAHSTILILGSFPSVRSREQSFYYGHPQNRFWKVLAAILQVETPVTVPAKRTMLLENRIAVYDVIERCEIKGSSDSSIRQAVPADIRRMVEESAIRWIFTNGRTAGKLFRKYQAADVEIPMTELPSTSPANAAYSLERLIEIWGEEVLQVLREQSEGDEGR
ncbi:MAG: DNA-deoxyinosine glycosylase [Lachnospiraceae bacterium]|nr:DNA-deoxyinosine glycosylase [Lachnospiraceae bacterium]